MSQENVELIRRFVDEWNRGEINESSIRATYHPDGVFLPLRSATEGVYRGIAAEDLPHAVWRDDDPAPLLPCEL